MNETNFGVNEEVDLTNCDREPIHIPGSIQPHGAILAIDESAMQVVQTSANAMEIIGFAPDELLGESWGKFLPAETLAYLEREILPKNLEATPLYLPPFRTVAGKDVEAIIHRFDGVLILELEENRASENESSLALYASLKATLAQLEATKSVADFCQKAAEQVREFTNFDRVMIYRFAEDDSGAVVAEARRDDLESFQGVNYPASDIPKQARALYLKSWLRFKVDNDADSVPLLPELNPKTGKPLDLSYAVLRSMSPVHTEYLRNMGVRATMSLSIIRDEKLWGLVACHHYAAPRYVAHDARMAREFLAHFLSLQMAAKEASENHEYIRHLTVRHAELVELMAQTDDFMQVLLDHDEKFLEWIKADGAAFVVKDEIRLFGKTPSTKEVGAILEWLDAHGGDEIYATDHFAADCQTADCRDTAAGVLAVRLSKKMPNFILWFRPEISQSVNWAGDPAKPVEIGEFGERLTPRKSFDLWVEEVAGKSAPWLECEIEAVGNLRRSIIEIIVRKAEVLANLNEELQRSNIELDSFAYIASHDLKEPLRGIHNFSHILIENYSADLPEDGRVKLQTLMRLTQRMESLIESLLHYSRIGRTELSKAKVDLNKVVRETLEMIESRISEKTTEIIVAENLPSVEADEVLLREVFTNLLTNAVKYNDKQIRRVEIGFNETDGRNFYVRDNGIGIAEKNHETIFRIFKRLHGRDKFGGGIGAGLTITKKIVERHGGNLWLESLPDQGTTFYFTLGAAE